MRTEDIAIVTTYKREPLLYLCLEAMRRLHADLRIYVFSDRGADSTELREVCDTFGAVRVVREPHNFYGNSYNLLDAVTWALREFPDLQRVHLVEDDTIVHRAWLTWADQQLRHGSYVEDNFVPHFAAVCARIHGDPATVWIESPCVSWNAWPLRQAVAMIPDGYFTETREQMQKVVDAKFPKSKFRYGSSEQDGFFLRCVEHFGWKTKWPTVSLATHLGFVGYNRPTGPQIEGDCLASRIEFCRSILNDKRRRYELFGQRITDLEWEGERRDA